MIENRFLHFLTLSTFETKRSQIPNSAIVFIDSDANNKPTIWTHGKYYSVGDSSNAYKLPIAAANTLGGIKIGSGLSITSDGVLSINSSYDGDIGSLEIVDEALDIPTRPESFATNIQLHKVSKTGNIADLNGWPGFTTSVTSGSNKLITSGAVAATLSNSYVAKTSLKTINNISLIATSGDTNIEIGPSENGTDNYNDLTNKPQISGTTLSGNKSLDDLNIQSKITIGDTSNFLAFGQNNNIVDSGYSDDSFLKKPNTFTENNIVIFDKKGNAKDSGHSLNEYQEALNEYANYTGIGSSTTIPVITTNKLGQVTNITTANLDLSNYFSLAQGNALAARIDYLYAYLVGVTITATPSVDHIYAGNETTITVSITTTETVDTVTVSRTMDGTTTNNVYNNTDGNSWSFTDTVTPQQSGQIIYTVTTTKQSGGQSPVVKSAQTALSVENKATVNLSYNSDSATIYLGRTPYVFPTLSGADGLTIRYTSYPTGIVSIDQNGNITPIAAGDTLIRANFDGDSSHAATSASYTLQVRLDTVYEIEWDGGVEETEIELGERTRLDYGTITAHYISGYDDTADGGRNNVTFSPQYGQIENGYYVAPSSGDSDTITVTVRYDYNNTYANRVYTISMTIISNSPQEPDEPNEPQVGSGHLYTASAARYEDIGENDWNDRGVFDGAMTIEIENQANQYIFIKTDSQQTISKVYVNGNLSAAERELITMDGPYVIDGGAHYYKTHRMYTMAFTNPGGVYRIEE